MEGNWKWICSQMESDQRSIDGNRKQVIISKLLCVCACGKKWKAVVALSRELTERFGRKRRAARNEYLKRKRLTIRLMSHLLCMVIMNRRSCGWLSLCHFSWFNCYNFNHLLLQFGSLIQKRHFYKINEIVWHQLTLGCSAFFRSFMLLGDSGGVVNSLEFCLAPLKSLGCFYFRCVLWQWICEFYTANFKGIFGGP